jgi:hypothetical protein
MLMGATIAAMLPVIDGGKLRAASLLWQAVDTNNSERRSSADDHVNSCQDEFQLTPRDFPNPLDKLAFVQGHYQ